jgi:hypothetical protein
MNARGRASGSFLIAVGVVILAVGGYLAWTFLRPDPYALSERVVRDARRALAYEVREFQRGLDDVVRNARRSNADVGKAIDAAADKARKDLDDVVTDARDRLSEIDVELRTQRNRMDRIEIRAQEAREIVTEFAEETKAKAQATPPG